MGRLRWSPGVGLAVAYLVLCVAQLVVAIPLGHDESVYAMAAKSWLERGVWDADVYRPVGTMVLALPGTLLGGHAIAMRLVPTLWTGAFLAVTWRLVAQHAPDAKPVAAIALVLWSGLWPRAIELLPDIPAATLFLVVVWLCDVRTFPTLNRVGRWAVIGLLAAMAIWIRYGLTPTLVVFFAVLVWRPPRGARRVHVVLAGAVATAALMPLALRSQALTGSFVGILLAGKAVAGQNYVGDGAVYYATRWGIDVFGPLAGAMVLAALVAPWRRDRSDDPLPRALAITCLIHLTWLGLSSHGEARFLFPVGALGIAFGGQVALTWWQRIGRTWRCVLLGVSVVIIVVTLVLTQRGKARRYGAMETAARSIVQDHIARRGHPPTRSSCFVTTSAKPEMAWYSGCETYRAFSAPVHYAVWLRRGPRRQPELLHGDEVLVTPDVRVVRLAPISW